MELFANHRDFVICEAPVISTPKITKKGKDFVRFETVLQTFGVFNRNGRRYFKEDMSAAINEIAPRVAPSANRKEILTGELDHPIVEKENVQRQFIVSWLDSSHMFLEIGWDGDELRGTLQTLQATEKGRVLRDLILKDDLYPGFSFRGLGEVKEITEGVGAGQNKFDVRSPMKIITWDSVTFPSHEGANVVRMTESVQREVYSGLDAYLTEAGTYTEQGGYICFENGTCVLPDTFDKLVEKRLLRLKKRYN